MSRTLEVHQTCNVSNASHDTGSHHRDCHAEQELAREASAPSHNSFYGAGLADDDTLAFDIRYGVSGVHHLIIGLNVDADAALADTAEMELSTT